MNKIILIHKICFIYFGICLNKQNVCIIEVIDFYENYDDSHIKQ